MACSDEQLIQMFENGGISGRGKKPHLVNTSKKPAQTPPEPTKAAVPAGDRVPIILNLRRLFNKSHLTALYKSRARRNKKPTKKQLQRDQIPAPMAADLRTAFEHTDNLAKKGVFLKGDCILPSVMLFGRVLYVTLLVFNSTLRSVAVVTLKLPVEVIEAELLTHIVRCPAWDAAAHAKLFDRVVTTVMYSVPPKHFEHENLWEAACASFLKSTDLPACLNVVQQLYGPVILKARSKHLVDMKTIRMENNLRNVQLFVYCAQNYDKIPWGIPKVDPPVKTGSKKKKKKPKKPKLGHP